MKKFFQNLPGGIKFLLTVVVVYAGIGIFSSSFAQDAWNDFLQTFLGVLKILFFVFFAMFLMNLWVRQETISKHLGNGSGIKGWLYAILGSIVIVGPPYVLLPYLGELQRQGMKNSLIAAFMGNRIVSPVFIPVMVYYFGLMFTAVVSVLVLVFAVIDGYLVGKILDRQK